ncbi:MAG: hypothetical protein JO061_15865 [Acidobacteriaceae bacterium]|nr:hypothetical protein [Acidobacteriaceae bacterium]
MSIKSRTHAVTFRLGDRQYQELVRAVESQGARSVSDFTRTAALARIVSNQSEHFVERELDDIVVQLEALDARIRELRRGVRRVSAVSRPIDE